MAKPTSFETPFHWTCPYCGRDTTIIYVSGGGRGLSGGSLGLLHAEVTSVECPNPECQGVQITFQLSKGKNVGTYSGTKPTEFIREWTLIPPSAAKAFPSYIPEQIRADYQEACLLVQPSPKASATMSRRCLQGMIHDFHGIAKARLKDEIDALEGIVEPDVWEAIDSVRQVGNIGAHMEKDVNLIIDVEPEEANLLIWLIEHLMKQWYINREERKKKLAEIRALPEAKKALAAPKIAERSGEVASK